VPTTAVNALCGCLLLSLRFGRALYSIIFFNLLFDIAKSCFSIALQFYNLKKENSTYSFQQVCIFFVQFSETKEGLAFAAVFPIYAHLCK
jgi:hypothetical protein